MVKATIGSIGSRICQLLCRLLILVIALFFVSFLIRTAFAQDGLTKIADNVYCYVDTKMLP
ncbi:MAG TPA: hypothetical protein PKA28_10535 [Methylomusa anaerophila]|uniref:Uncharacterized protein n=1 Tax=Methylomusa anaerophila TaxID=1930071 RepID=A0A348AIV2_9FIRM|nr:hypothetical protein [Methylomusa anaerophila]BBB91000.1 hypothetical protein MAMMFC1_01667 [Methylomusa anaerophila]HML88871.1 hypothetical protein [Methylomusa anaerophila]